MTYNIIGHILLHHKGSKSTQYQGDWARWKLYLCWTVHVCKIFPQVLILMLINDMHVAWRSSYFKYRDSNEKNSIYQCHVSIIIFVQYDFPVVIFLYTNLLRWKQTYYLVILVNKSTSPLYPEILELAFQRMDLAFINMKFSQPAPLCFALNFFFFFAYSCGRKINFLLLQNNTAKTNTLRGKWNYIKKTHLMIGSHIAKFRYYHSNFFFSGTELLRFSLVRWYRHKHRTLKYCHQNSSKKPYIWSVVYPSHEWRLWLVFDRFMKYL